jgi:hypothetical protein
MNTTLPQRDLDDNNIRYMERRLIDAMLRYSPTYPTAADSEGRRGDYSISDDGGTLAIHNGTEWKKITFNDF